MNVFRTSLKPLMPRFFRFSPHLRRRVALAGIVAAAAMASVAPAAQAADMPFEISLTGQPTRYLVEGRPYAITGHGSARFGMSLVEVRAAVARDYPETVSPPHEYVDPDSGAIDLTVRVAALPRVPAPTPVLLRYRFGSVSGRLVAVDVEWTTDGPSTPAQRAGLVEAARTVGATMAGWRWPPLATRRGHLLPDGTLIVFSGKDFEGAGAEIRLLGADVDVEARERTATSPARAREHRVASPGPSQLRLRVVANVDRPDPYPAMDPESAAASTAAAGAYRVSGFRSALFGMDEAALRGAIQRDFKTAPEAIRVVEDPKAGKRALVLRLDQLEPGPVPATVTYILDQATGRLTHVNVVWTTDAAPDEALRLRMADAGGQLARAFQQLGWRPGTTVSKMEADNRQALLFGGVDAQGGALELRISGVPMQRAGQAPVVAEGPAVLRAAFYANTTK